jgi:YbbR domain-containing protein
VEGKRKIEFEKKGDRKAGVFNRDLVVFLFFLILSFVFWYLNSLGKEVDSYVRYPVRYINSPKDRVLIGDIPSKLDIYMKGPGYSILKLKLSGNQAPVIIDLSTVNYARVPNSRLLSFYIITSGLIQSFEQQLRADFEITSIKPDTLYFIFDRVITKKVPVIPDVEVTTQRQYFVKGVITSTPDKVEISGPRQIIDTIKAVKTKYYKFNQLNKSSTKSLTLIGSKNFDLNIKRVSVTVTVEQFTEAGIDIPVRLLNLPDSLEIKIFPDEVSVKYLVGISDYKTINELPIEAVIDLSDYNLQEVNKLQVVIQRVPPYISSLKFSPQKVDFIIEKKRK